MNENKLSGDSRAPSTSSQFIRPWRDWFLVPSLDPSQKQVGKEDPVLVIVPSHYFEMLCYHQAAQCVFA